MLQLKFERFWDPHAASSQEHDSKVCGELGQKSTFLSLYSFAYSSEQLCGLLGWKDKGDGSIFLEKGDVPKGVFLHIPFPDQELIEGTKCYDDFIDRNCLHAEIGSHLQEK